jgi:hypothetical protein
MESISVLHPSSFLELIITASVACAGKSGILYDDLSTFRVRDLTPLAISARTSVLFRNLAWNHSHSFIVTPGKNKRMWAPGFTGPAL